MNFKQFKKIISEVDEVGDLKIAQHQNKIAAASREAVINSGNHYMQQYKDSGHKIENRSWNADGSLTFTTISSKGKVTHRTFHKGKRSKVDGGHTHTNGTEDYNDGLGKEADVVDKSTPNLGKVAGDKGKALQDILLGRMKAKIPARDTWKTRTSVKGKAQSGPQPESDEDKRA